MEQKVVPNLAAKANKVKEPIENHVSF